MRMLLRSSLIVMVALTLPLTAAAANKPETPDMELIEFLGSLETRGNSGKEILTAIDTGLLPDLPEEPPYDDAQK
ncbi:MAG: hypothetical protein NUV55_07065 [Sulfuricaulis sp.]|uniref:hypothetical protein n=1 Tax=Sulfuricaulis sp. TaxID=2003553 RepID=UPI0025D18E0B|nr:hypothetical protein [Sulfuricaulis sp.]MCR4346946.1 hypothetical protein [Sulfuricaulis sp.]